MQISHILPLNIMKNHMGESFLALAQNNLRPNGLYLFDEPEAVLSPQRQLTLLMQIYSCANEEKIWNNVSNKLLRNFVESNDMDYIRDRKRNVI